VTYTVLTNFYDGMSPLTTVINLDCRQSPVQFVQVGNFVNVTGTIANEILPGAAQPTPVIHASFVQVLWLRLTRDLHRHIARDMCPRSELAGQIVPPAPYRVIDVNAARLRGGAGIRRLVAVCVDTGRHRLP
jgi:hypothetical protein